MKLIKKFGVTILVGVAALIAGAMFSGQIKDLISKVGIKL